MKKDNYILRNEKIKKWVGMRKGRTSLLADLVGVKRTNLHNQIFENRLSPELVQMIERRQLGLAACYVVGSVVLAIGALFVGLMIARRAFGVSV